MTSVHAYESLFRPGRIGPLTAKNRLVMPPIVRNYADIRGRATPRYVAHIERIARGGVGTIVIEASYVCQEGKGFANQLGVHDTGTLPGLRALVDAGHRYGALMGIQLYHGGRQSSSQTSGAQPVAPSAIPDPVVNELPRELSVAEIGAIVVAYGAAAERAKAAGFDFVELHGAHGYLIAQFLSPFSNRREDAYGGTPEKRRRFLEEVYAQVRAGTGAHFPITVRLSGEENVPGGLTLEETAGTAKRLEELGAAALHVTCGNYATYEQGMMIPPMAVPDGVLLPLAERVKNAVTIPVIAVGKIRTPEMAEEIVRKGKADFVAIGRSLLADPDWPAKVAGGKRALVRHCVACNQGCISRLFQQQAVWCTINPETSRELAFANLGGGDGRCVVVIGGGPAGMTAARYAAMVGFRVVLHEARSVLGGQLIAAAAAPHREDWSGLCEHMIAELDRLGVEVHLNSTVNVERVLREKPYAVVVATGSEPVRPRISGWSGMRVATGRDILEQQAPHQGRIVIAGGGCSGAQTAEYLAGCGHDVTVLEMTDGIAQDAPSDERNLLLKRLRERGVELMPNTRLVSAALGSAVVSSPHETRMLPADMIVMCLGTKPVDALARELEKTGIPLAVVGDAAKPRKITEAIAEGALAVLNLLGVGMDSALRAEMQPAIAATSTTATLDNA